MAVAQKFLVYQVGESMAGHGYKWSLLKVNEGKYKRLHGGPRWNLDACFSSLAAFIMLTYGKGRTS
jgi:hypothetical protein